MPKQNPYKNPTILSDQEETNTTKDKTYKTFKESKTSSERNEEKTLTQQEFGKIESELAKLDHNTTGHYELKFIEMVWVEHTK